MQIAKCELEEKRFDAKTEKARHCPDWHGFPLNLIIIDYYYKPLCTPCSYLPTYMI